MKVLGERVCVLCVSSLTPDVLVLCASSSLWGGVRLVCVLADPWCVGVVCVL